MTKANETKELIKKRALEDLEFFINLIHPNRVLGRCHTDAISWMNRQEAKDFQLILLPRDHQKSSLIAYRVAWEITKNPAIRVIYVSATSNLATKQLGFIKEILTSDTYRFYWPEMVHKDKSKRKKWTESEIEVDHHRRKDESVRDPTVFAAGLVTTTTGLHCDILVLDDIVVDDNSGDKSSREDLSIRAGFYTSIAGTDARVWVVGTRYHPEDYYYELMATSYDVYNENGEVIGRTPLYELYERAVEDRGDGTGIFLWPRQQRTDGKWFGFDRNILSIKRAGYKDYAKYRSQYYNDPTAVGGTNFSKSSFQYYERKHLTNSAGSWWIKDRKLNVFAAMDFAYSTKERADYTCIVVIGIDSNNMIYVLDIDRFKTGKISDYYSSILRMYTKWGFRKLSVEVTAAQSVIVKDLKDNYIRANGLALSIHETKPTSRKEDRIESVLQPRYENLQVWHFAGGNCELLEEELVAAKPTHDDIKDALSNAIEIAVPPAPSHRANSRLVSNMNRNYNNRFGGFTIVTYTLLLPLLWAISNGTS